MIISCHNPTSQHFEEREVIFEGFTGDSVVVFYGNNNDTLNIFRQVEIVENLNNDTINLGYGISPPGYTGYIYFIQDGLDSSKAVYLESNANPDANRSDSYAKMFTLRLWNPKPPAVFKRLVVRVKLKK